MILIAWIVEGVILLLAACILGVPWLMFRIENR